MEKRLEDRHANTRESERPLIEVKNLKQYFPVSDGLFRTKYVKAVDDVSFYINKGETLGLVGESGCGKTTTGRSLLRLYEPTGGKIFYDGEDITHADMMPYRRKMQIVFQDPYASLNPRMTIADLVGEPIDITNWLIPRKSVQKELWKCWTGRLNSEHANRYPHEFSGGTTKQGFGCRSGIYRM